MQRGSLTDFSSMEKATMEKATSRHYAWSLSAHRDPAWMPSSMTQRMAEQLKGQPYAQPTWAGSRASWTCCYEML